MRPVKYRDDLVLAAYLSTTLAFVLSITNIVLSALAISWRFRCDELRQSYSVNGAQYFRDTIIRTFLVEEKCPKSLNFENTTHADTVFILAIIVLTIAAINLVLAFSVFVVINYIAFPPRSVAIFYAYVGSSVALVVVDVVVGILVFWSDYNVMTEKLRQTFGGDSENYIYDMIRLGAMMLTFAAFKGYIGHAINILLLVVLIACVVKHQKKLQKENPGRKKLSVLDAYGFRDDQESRPRPMALRGNNNIFDISNFDGSPIDHNWPPARLPPRNETFMAHPTSGQLNPTYFGEPTRQAMLENSLPERNNERTQSWLHNSGGDMGTRPFSYLESPKQNLPVVPPATSAGELQWRRDAWPPVPDPDYSPPPRKLKRNNGRAQWLHSSGGGVGIPPFSYRRDARPPVRVPDPDYSPPTRRLKSALKSST